MPIRKIFATIALLAVFAIAACAAPPSGTIKVWDGGAGTGALLATLTIDPGYNPNFQSSTLAVGSHSLTFDYSGDGTYPPGVSDPVVLTVTGNGSSIVVGSCTPNPVQAGALASCVVTVTAGP